MMIVYDTLSLNIQKPLTSISGIREALKVKQCPICIIKWQNIRKKIKLFLRE